MTAIMEQEITTYLHEATSLHKWLFLEHYHQIRALFIYTAPKSMLSIWVQKQAGCRREAFFSLTEPRLCTSTINFPSFVGSWYSTEHCSLSLGSKDWQVMLDIVLKVQSMIQYANSKILTTSSRGDFPVFERNSSPEHLFNARKKLRNYINRSCPVNLSTHAAFFYWQTIKALPWHEFIYLFVNKNESTDIFHFEIVPHGSIINWAQLLYDFICSD